jgi:hypothetical protein
MRSSLLLPLMVLMPLLACGGPILQNAPAPDPVHVAAAAATAAAALTLADPDAAAHKQEKDESNEGGGEVQSVGHVPHDVLDRLDEAKAHARAGDPPPE